MLCLCCIMYAVEGQRSAVVVHQPSGDSARQCLRCCRSQWRSRMHDVLEGRVSLHDASSVVKEAISKAEDLKSELIMLQVGSRWGERGRGRPAVVAGHTCAGCSAASLRCRLPCKHGGDKLCVSALALPLLLCTAQPSQHTCQLGPDMAGPTAVAVAVLLTPALPWPCCRPLPPAGVSARPW